jgi:UPF0755 protein
MRRFLLVAAAALLLLVGTAFWFLGSWTASGPAAQPTAVIIAEGSSLASAAAQLQKAGVLASADRFRLQARLLGGSKPIQAGEYELPAGASRLRSCRCCRAARPSSASSSSRRGCRRSWCGSG